MSTVIARAAAVLVAVYVVLPKSWIVDGLFQRTYQVLQTPWFIVMGFWLLNSPPTARRSVRPGSAFESGHPGRRGTPEQPDATE
jgi:hypothetical protein